jgi:hypothetical protein
MSWRSYRVPASLAGCVALLLTAGAGPLGAGDAPPPKKVEDRLTDLEGKVEGLRRDLDELKGLRADLAEIKAGVKAVLQGGRGFAAAAKEVDGQEDKSERGGPKREGKRVTRDPAEGDLAIPPELDKRLRAIEGRLGYLETALLSPFPGVGQPFARPAFVVVGHDPRYGWLIRDAWGRLRYTRHLPLGAAGPLGLSVPAPSLVAVTEVVPVPAVPAQQFSMTQTGPLTSHLSSLQATATPVVGVRLRDAESDYLTASIHQRLRWWQTNLQYFDHPQRLPPISVAFPGAAFPGVFPAPF